MVRVVAAILLRILDNFHTRMDKDFLASSIDTRKAGIDINVSSRIFGKGIRLPSSSSISCMGRSREAAWSIIPIGRVLNIIIYDGDKDSIQG